MDIDGKTVLITGGGRGVGLAIAKAFADQGARVAICGRKMSTLEKAAKAIGPGTVYFTVDLADQNAPLIIADKIESHFGGLDILINNAGVQLNYSLFGRSYADVSKDIDFEFKVDLIAPIKLAVALLPHMRNSEESAIINIGSGLALAPKTSAPIYCAAKAGLRNFTRVLRYQAEHHAKNLKIVDVVLPMVSTDMTAGRGSGKIEPEEVAIKLLRGLRANREEIRVGKAGILSFIMRLTPKLGYRILKGEPNSLPTHV